MKTSDRVKKFSLCVDCEKCKKGEGEEEDCPFNDYVRGAYCIGPKNS